MTACASVRCQWRGEVLQAGNLSCDHRSWSASSGMAWNAARRKKNHPSPLHASYHRHLAAHLSHLGFITTTKFACCFPGSRGDALLTRDALVLILQPQLVALLSFRPAPLGSSELIVRIVSLVFNPCTTFNAHIHASLILLASPLRYRRS